MYSDLEHVFTHHKPKSDQVEKYREIRAAGHALAKSIQENCPRCQDADLAITLVRQAVHMANAAIALEGLR